MGDSVNKVIFGSDTLIDLTEDTVTPDMVADGLYFHQANGVRTAGTAKYAASPSAGGPAIVTNGIHHGKVDSTSTATKFTATIPGITSLYDGLTVLLYNGVITSASGFTLNINGLGEYGSYSNMALGNPVTPTNPTRDTTLFNINYAMLFVFSTNIYDGISGWICYRGYDANTNTLGYQLRTNSTRLSASDKFYRYRLLFQSPDGQKLVPANTSTSTNATSARTVNTRPIDPFGLIYYYGTTTAIDAGGKPSAAYLWQQYVITLGYSFNNTGAALALTAYKSVYLRCAPQADGSAVMEYFTQDLPSTDDGKIYIFLGVAVDATTMELSIIHPVYCYKNGSIRQWINAYIPTKTSDLTNDSGFITGYTETDPTVPAWAKNPTKPTYTASEVGALPDNTSIPTKTSDLTNDSGFITGYTETDPTVPAWAKAASKPTYTASEVGALPSSTVIPSKTSDLTNDSGFITGYTETDPTVPSWAKAASKPTYTASEVGALPSSTVIPSKTSDLTNDSGFITGYTETDPTVPAWAKAASKPTYTASEVGAIPAILTSDFYGNTLPEPGTPGRIFFLKV